MYFIIKAAIRSLLLPPASPLILALVGALLSWRGRRVGGVLLAVGLISLWLFATPIVADGVTRLAERYPAFDVSKPTAAQAIVIIGGGGQRRFAPEYQGPEAEYSLLERLNYGAYVARHTGLPILVSGARTEALVMQTSLMRDFGAAARWVDNQSRDTFENARLTAHILKPLGIDHIILITSNTHMWRAAHEFMDAGFDVVPAPVGMWGPREDGVFRFMPDPGALMRSNLAVYELIGEPMRELQAGLGLRERFDSRAAGASEATGGAVK
jgi:uncharacterized SAM-binding protein YcdF (DUF218 family)